MTSKTIISICTRRVVKRTICFIYSFRSSSTTPWLFGICLAFVCTLYPLTNIICSLITIITLTTLLLECFMPCSPMTFVGYCAVYQTLRVGILFVAPCSVSLMIGSYIWQMKFRLALVPLNFLILGVPGLQEGGPCNLCVGAFSPHDGPIVVVQSATRRRRSLNALSRESANVCINSCCFRSVIK